MKRFALCVGGAVFACLVIQGQRYGTGYHAPLRTDAWTDDPWLLSGICFALAYLLGASGRWRRERANRRGLEQIWRGPAKETSRQRAPRSRQAQRTIDYIRRPGWTAQGATYDPPA